MSGPGWIEWTTLGLWTLNLLTLLFWLGVRMARPAPAAGRRRAAGGAEAAQPGAVDPVEARLAESIRRWRDSHAAAPPATVGEAR